MAEMTAITVRRYPLPPPAPRIRLDTVQQQESARRLVHAAAFAPATHQADLSLATDAVPAVIPAPAAPLPQPAATQTGILRTRQLDGEFTNSSSARDSTRSTKRVRVESPAADAITTEAGAGLKRKRREGSAEATLFDITVEVQPPSSATDGQGDITGLVGPLDDQAEGAIQRCIPFVSQPPFVFGVDTCS